MSVEDTAQRRHEEFMRQQHERGLTQASIQANAAAAELIAERIAAKLAEQNDIIYRIGQKQGRTSLVAYVSLAIGGVAAVGQLFGPIWEWPVFKGIFG
ncbi:MAG: hypothetical protein WBP94_11280 [Rhodomicrobiaceae bacterium]